MSNLVISTLREKLQERIEASEPASDLAMFVADSLKKNIKSSHYTGISVMIGGYNRILDDYHESLITEEVFKVETNKFCKKLLGKLSRFERLDKLGVLRPSNDFVMPSTNAVLVDREKLIGNRNYFKADWLRKGDSISKEICKIRLEDDSSATGIHLAGGYILTNRHVLPNKEAADTAELIFNYTSNRRDTETIVRNLDTTSDFIIGNDNTGDILQDYDFALFKLKGAIDLPGVQIADGFGLPKQGDNVCIIQHPQGKPLRISIGPVEGSDSQMLHYGADTEKGSSGSPVFDNKWNMVALHFGSKPEENFNRGLRIDQLLEFIGPKWKNLLSGN